MQNSMQKARCSNKTRSKSTVTGKRYTFALENALQQTKEKNQ